MDTAKHKLILQLLSDNLTSYTKIAVTNITEICTIKIIFNDKIAYLNFDEKRLEKIPIEHIKEEFDKEHVYGAIMAFSHPHVSVFSKDSFLLEVLYK